MKNGKENSTRSAFSCTEVSGGNRGGSAGRDGFAGYFESKFRSLCWDGCKYDRGSEKYHCGGSGPFQFPMINPVITKKDGAYQTEEGCLSLDGVRPCTRYQEIEVDYLDQNFKKRHGKYSGWTAQIIQHEIDHCNGIII